MRRGDTYYILTNWQATNFRLMKVAIKDAADKSKWQEVVAHNPNARIEDELVLKDYLIIQTRENGLTRIKVMPFNGQKPFELSFDEPAYVMGLDVNSQQDSNKLRIFYSSLTTPEAVYEYSLVNPDRRDLLKQDQVLGGFDASQYRAERVFVTARDGVKVPVSLVYRKALTLCINMVMDLTVTLLNPIFLHPLSVCSIAVLCMPSPMCAAQKCSVALGMTTVSC